MAANATTTTTTTAAPPSTPAATTGANQPSLPVAPTNTQQSSGASAAPVLNNAAGSPPTGTNVQPPTSSSQPPGTANATQPSTAVNANRPPAVVNANQPTTAVNGNLPPPVVNGNQPPSVKEWTSMWLGWWILLLTAGLTVAFLAATITLTVLSARNNGFISTKLETQVLPSFLSTINVGISVVWTFLPSLIFQLYGLIVGAIVNAAGIRQPYIELREASRDGAPPEKSILLDYQSYWFLGAPFRALQYSHYMLAYSFVVALLLKILLAPLGAHLFYTTTAYVPHDIEIQQTSFFNENGLVAQDSMQPILEVVSSTLIYGARPPSWTTLDTSFAPLSVPDSYTQRTGVTNFTIHTHGFTAHMNCAVLGSDEFEIGRNALGEWDFRAFDRGCGSGEKFFESKLNSWQLEFLETYSLDCSWAAQQSRILVIGALRENSSSNSGLKNITAVSCIPTYSHSKGSLTVSFDAASPSYPNIYNFTNTTNTTYKELPQFGQVFGFQLVQQVAYLDITDALSATAYGNVIYRYAKTLSSDAYMSGDILMKATNATFVAGFAVAASQYLFQSGTPQTVRATYISSDTRVVVVLAIACTICSLLFLALVMLVWILLYTHKHHSILYEEPTALVGAAAILRQSTLLSEVQDIVADRRTGEAIKPFIAHQRRTTPIKGWSYEDWNNPSKAVLKQAP